MGSRIQFRVDETTKRLAQVRAESQGRTLRGACRELTAQLAEQQRKALAHDDWLAGQLPPLSSGAMPIQNILKTPKPLSDSYNTKMIEYSIKWSKP